MVQMNNSYIIIKYYFHLGISQSYPQTWHLTCYATYYCICAIHGLNIVPENSGIIIHFRMGLWASVHFFLMSSLIAFVIFLSSPL